MEAEISQRQRIRMTGRNMVLSGRSAHMARNHVNQNAGHNAANEEDLSDIDVGRDGLGEGVVDRKACHRQSHEQRSRVLSVNAMMPSQERGRDAGLPQRGDSVHSSCPKVVAW